MTFMGQPPSGGYQTWICGECGRLHLALALDACPECEAPRPGSVLEPEAVVPVTVPPAPVRTARTRTRARTARGGGRNA